MNPLSSYTFKQVLLIVTWIAISAILSKDQAAVVPLPTQRLQTIADRIQTLESKAITFWKKHGPDPIYGGFLGTLDRDGNKISPTDKGIVQEARHLWTFSMYYKRREASDSVKAIADNLYNFIVKNFRDSVTDRFYTTLTETGGIKSANHQLYMDGFAMYALSQYALTFNNPDAANYALKCFRAIEKTRHDSLYGGYIETGEPNFLSYGGVKETNTQMHLMETFTTLYEATADTLAKTRLTEMANLMITKVKQPAGYNSLEFGRDWTPVAPAIVSFGHDLEASWLLMEAARVLGKPDDSMIIKAANTIGAFSAQKGWHAAKGGYYAQGQVASAAITDSSKVWWIQAEALEGLWWMYKFTGDTIYLNRMEGTLNWIEQYQLNQAAGEWYNTCTTTGSVSGSTNMGDAWKASYHSMRSLMFTGDWIRNALLGVKALNSAPASTRRMFIEVDRTRASVYRIRVPFPGRYRINILAANGRIVKTLFCGNQNAILWNAGTPGVYIFQGFAPGAAMQCIYQMNIVSP